MKVLLVFLVLELTAVVVVDCLNCYSCTRCNDPFEKSSSKSTTKCPSGQCKKSRTEAFGVTSVSRSCSYFKMDNKCSEQEQFGIESEECYCDTELCNGSSTAGTSLKWLLLLAAVVVIITPLTH